MAGCAGQPAEAPDAPSSEPMEYQIPQLEADPAAYGSKLTAYDMAAFDVLLDGAAGNNTEAQDALRLCPGIITTLRYGQEQDWTAELLQPIHDLMAYFEANGRLPCEPYDAEITEYATSMDAPLLGVAAQLAYERTGEEQYAAYVQELIPYIVSSTEDGGFVLKLDDETWWPLEYAWRGMTPETAWFVLNGSLYGTVCVKMLENATGDARLTEWREKATNAYRIYLDRFYYPDGNWCWYALNFKDGAPVIDMPEKLFIELRALKSLYRMTGEPLFLEHYQRRTALLAELLPCTVVRGESTDTAILYRACAPHPYEVDIYPNVLELLDSAGQVIATGEASDRSAAYHTLSVPLTGEAAYYRLYAQVNPIEKTLLLEAPVQYADAAELAAEPLSGEWQPSGDTVSITGGLMEIDPALHEDLKAYAYFKADEPQACDNQTYWVVEVENETDRTYPMSLYFYNQDGVGLSRTGLPVPPGRSLQIYSALGFKGYPDSVTASDLFSLNFITDGMEETGTVRLGNVYAFSSPAALALYLQNYSFTDFWQIAE